MTDIRGLRWDVITEVSQIEEINILRHNSRALKYILHTNGNLQKGQKVYISGKVFGLVRAAMSDFLRQPCSR